MTSQRLYWDCTDGHPFPEVYDQVAHNLLYAGFSVAQSQHFEAQRLQHSKEVGLQVLKDAWQSDYVFPVQHLGNCFRIIREKLGPIATSSLSRKGMREMFAGQIIDVSPDGLHQFAAEVAVFGYQAVNHEIGLRADVSNISRYVNLEIADCSELIGRENFKAQTLSIARASAWAGPANACFIIDPENVLKLDPREFPPLQLDPLLFGFAVVSWEVNAEHISERFAENQKILDLLIAGLSRFGDITIHTPRDPSLRASHLLSFSISQCDSEFAARLYDEQGVSVGSQSACLANSGQPSDVLRALGIDTAGHIRVSLPVNADVKDVDRFLSTTELVVARVQDEKLFLAE
jgi:hypothetical protein